MRSRHWFTFGGLLARYWRPAYPLLPYALTSALLMAAGCWDRWTREAPVEWMVVGLAAYEFMIGLLVNAEPAGARVSVHASMPSSATIPSVEI
jgi:hypothetical protein